MQRKKPTRKEVTHRRNDKVGAKLSRGVRNDYRRKKDAIKGDEYFAQMYGYA